MVRLLNRFTSISGCSRRFCSSTNQVHTTIDAATMARIAGLAQPSSPPKETTITSRAMPSTESTLPR